MLAKLASAYETDLARSVLVDILNEPSIMEPDWMGIEVQQPSWMAPVVEYLKGTIPMNRAEA